MKWYERANYPTVHRIVLLLRYFVFIFIPSHNAIPLLKKTCELLHMNVCPTEQVNLLFKIKLYKNRQCVWIKVLKVCIIEPAFNMGGHITLSKGRNVTE